MRRALVLAVLSIATSLVANTGAGDAGAARAADRRYVPKPFPEGWYVSHATAPAETPVGDDTSLYARRDDLERGPAMAVTSVGVESGFDGLRDESPAPVRGLASSSLARNGRFAWLTWPDDTAQDLLHLVAGRDLGDAELIAAARAVQARTFPRRGVPDGLRAVRADSSVYGSASAQRITLVDATGKREVELEVSAGSPSIRAAQRFWAEQESKREHEHAPGRAAVLGRQDRVTVVARGEASPRTLQRIADSMRETDAAGWEAFRGRVADLPVTALFPGSSTANGVIVDGALEGTRWGVAFESGPLATAWSTIVTADLTTSGAGSGVPSGELPAVLSGGSVGTNGGALFAGVIPAAAASARFVPDGRAPVDAVLGPTTADGTHRYFAAWVPGGAGTIPLVVYDAAGNVLVQRRSFGCNVCEG
jgi:hypothetical protein